MQGATLFFREAQNFFLVNMLDVFRNRTASDTIIKTESAV
jgi:hypothetical protein